MNCPMNELLASARMGVMGNMIFYSSFESSCGSDGQKITTALRLGPADAGNAVTVLAGQTWNSSKHTTAHPVGSMVIQVNARCVPVVDIYGLGVASGHGIDGLILVV